MVKSNISAAASTQKGFDSTVTLSGRWRQDFSLFSKLYDQGHDPKGFKSGHDEEPDVFMRWCLRVMRFILPLQWSVKQGRDRNPVQLNLVSGSIKTSVEPPTRAWSIAIANQRHLLQ